MIPAQPPAVRRLLATARAARFRAERATAGRGAGQGAGRAQGLLEPVHLSVRDSRTLNLAVAALPDERIERAHLLVSRGHRRFRVPLAFERHARGGLLLAGTATLRNARDVPGEADALAGPRLGEGVWRLTVVTADARGRVQRRGIGLDRATEPPLTPTLPHAPDPRTGTLVRVVRCRGGRAVLQVTRSKPRAELLRFVPGGDGITVHGRLVRTSRGRRWRAKAVRRRDGVTVPVGAMWDGTEFSFALPLAQMAGAGPGQWVWDFHVEPETRGAPLPLGRWLTDVRDPAAACPTPFRVFALPGGSLIRAHAHFTKSGAFALTCWDISKETS
ncbi:hypothetical protein GCM10010277_14070 [Streptomyces longisporoflavus]|uniref:hypothetical protein n=1 Tax=Streptomyces longisporoflavus TaxID=28044 RepID=UPI00167D6365|nr:hypothetical protein [Streptomyces longisporoflavus]GGV30830.1 hypothetical protein GCM10010277_14070 [Streptomyces longisporoflavus]